MGTRPGQRYYPLGSLLVPKCGVHVVTIVILLTLLHPFIVTVLTPLHLFIVIVFTPFTTLHCHSHYTIAPIHYHSLYTVYTTSANSIGTSFYGLFGSTSSSILLLHLVMICPGRRRQPYHCYILSLHVQFTTASPKVSFHVVL